MESTYKKNITAT
jgi:hypothetical protein